MKKILFLTFLFFSINLCYGQAFDKDMEKAGKDFHKHSKKAGRAESKKPKKVSTLNGSKSGKKIEPKEKAVLVKKINCVAAILSQLKTELQYMLS